VRTTLGIPGYGQKRFDDSIPMDSPQTKTVYVLGAGFSAGAGLQLQNDVLRGLLDEISYSFSGIIPDTSEKEFQERLKNDLNEIRTFIGKCFPNTDQPLEDIFTLIDQTIQLRGHFAGYDHIGLICVRNHWLDLIYSFFHTNLAGYLKTADTLYQKFASYLLLARMRGGIESDPFSVISLNWDSLLEESVYQVLRKTDGIGKADVDHCVYTTPLDDSPHTPSPKQKAAGIFNVKILKIHGSISWLRCPNSNHLYTGLGCTHNAYDTYLRDRKSPFIAENYPDVEEISSPLLEPFIITPTYAKVFDQPHIQATWHNAYIELREASRIVFIGYSLPEADYHFRTLLRRAIRKETDIEVVLYTDDEPPSESEKESSAPSLNYNSSFAVDRYRRLFGDKRIDFNFLGVADLIHRCVSEKEFSSCVDEIKGFFSSL